MVSLVFELLFLSQTVNILNRISLKHFGDTCSFEFGMQLKWGKVAVMVWAEDGSSLRR